MREGSSKISAQLGSHFFIFVRLKKNQEIPSRGGSNSNESIAALSPGCAGLPDQRDPATIPGIAHRDHRGATRPDQRSNDGTLRRLFGEKLLLPVRPLREKVLPRVQGRSHGHPQA